MASPILTDYIALVRHRTRASRGTALFLHEMVADEIQDRLSEVNREFHQIAIVTPFPEVWSSRFPESRIVPDADILDLELGQYDLVIHALALHWSNDMVGQLIQSARALKPDGLFLGALLGGQTLSELRAALGQAEAEVSHGISPRVLPMGEIRELGGLLQRSGLALPVADSSVQRVSYRDIFHLMQDLRAMGETNALAGRLRRPTKRALFLRAAEIYANHYADEGRILATFETVFLTGWKPHSSQQQPLRPGSAVHRLAEALGADEARLRQDD